MSKLTMRTKMGRSEDVYLLARERIDALHDLCHEEVPEEAALGRHQEPEGFPCHALDGWAVVWLGRGGHGAAGGVAAPAIANCVYLG